MGGDQAGGHMTAEDNLDLFWEPPLKSLVVVKPSARCGVRPFDEHPLKVVQRSEVDGQVLFTCQTTGPKTTRQGRNGRRIDDTPCWSGYYTADQLLPAPAPAPQPKGEPRRG